MSETSDKIKQRRLDRMRQGKAACEIVNLVSDPEIALALVPLTEGEFDTCQQMAIRNINFDNMGEMALFDREFRRQIILRSAREPGDLSQPIFTEVQEIREQLESSDVNHLWDEYRTFTEEASPSLDEIDPEELDELKKAFSEADWKGLSGKSYWLLKRFLGSISAMQLPDNSPGSFLTSSLTSTKRS